MRNSPRPGDDLHDDPALVNPALAAHLRNTLGRVAATTPLDGVEISLDPAPTRRRPKPVTTLAGALAMIGLLGITAVNVGHDVPAVTPGSPAATVTDGSTPPGTEVVISASGIVGHPALESILTNGVIANVIAPGSQVAISSDTQDDLVVFTTVSATGTGTLFRTRPRRSVRAAGMPRVTR